MQVIRKPDSATNTEIAHGPSHGAPQWDRTTLRNATARSPCKDEISFLSVTVSSVLPQGVIHQVLEKLKIENITRAKVTNTKRVEKNLIAPIPMREAVINAIVHSDFSREIPPVFEIFNDKMIFTSYGGLLPGQSKEDFFSCSSMPRNRELMRVFKDVGLVEQLGSGMSRILKEYDKSIFHISEHFIKVEFPFSLPKDNTIIANGDDNGNEIGDDDSEMMKVLGLLEENASITAKQMSEQMDISARKVSRLIKALKENGKIIRVGSDRKGYWKITQ